MTTEERDFLDGLISSGLTESSWKKALADIVKLQTAKVFLDNLTAVGLTSEAWVDIRYKVDQLMATKNFIDGLKAAGFSRDTWSMVYVAALSVAKQDEDVSEEPNNVTELVDGTVIPGGFVGKTYHTTGTVTLGHFILTNGTFTAVTDEKIIFNGVEFEITPNPDALLYTLALSSQTNREGDNVTYSGTFAVTGCSVRYHSDSFATLREESTVVCKVKSDKPVTVRSDYTLRILDESIIGELTGFSDITTNKKTGHFIYGTADSGVGIGFSSEDTVDIKVTYDETTKAPIFTGGTGTTVTTPWYNKMTLTDEESYDKPLTVIDRITVNGQGVIGMLSVDVDSPVTFEYIGNNNVKTGDIILPVNYTIMFHKVGEESTVIVYGNIAALPSLGTVKLDITNGVVWFDDETMIYSKNNVIVDIVNSKLTGTVTGLTGLLYGKFSNLTINGEVKETLQGSNKFSAEESVDLYNFDTDPLLLKSLTFVDILKVWPYNPALREYFWEETAVTEQTTVEPVTKFLGDETEVGISQLSLPLRVYRAYVRALIGYTGEKQDTVAKRHDVALTAIGARKTFVDYAQRFQRLVRSVYKNYVSDKIDEEHPNEAEFLGSALKALCNIDLDNDDSGAIIGLDAGGLFSKKLSDIVVEPEGEISQDYPVSIYNETDGTRQIIIKGITFVLPKPDDLEAWQKRVICELAMWYYPAVLNTLVDVFGKSITFAAKNFSGIIKTTFVTETKATGKVITASWNTDKTLGAKTGFVEISLVTNTLKDLGHLSGNAGNTPIDIILLREMVNVFRWINMPDNDIKRYGAWFVEGGAEFSSGGIDKTRLAENINWSIPNQFVCLLTEQYNDSIALMDPYIWGTIFMRWLFKTLAEERSWTQPTIPTADTGSDDTAGGGSDG